MKEDFKNYKEVYKKIKILTGLGQEQLLKQLEEFEKTHSVIDIKQFSDRMMFVFYTE